MKTPTDKRSASKARIVRYIYESGHTSKVEIARQLGLSMPTVLQNVKELADEGLVEEIGAYESTGGRKARSLALCGSARYAIGLDITANHIGLVAVNLAGKVLLQERKRKSFVNSLDYWNDIGNEIRQMVEKLQFSHREPPDTGIASCILGVGISLPGIISQETEMLVKSHALKLDHVSLKMIGQAIPYPVYYENDASAAMMAEKSRAGNDCVYLSLSNTVGGSVCIGGEIFKGMNNKAGEFGHMVLFPSGKPCYCGKKGCLDAYCSALVLADHGGGSLDKFMDQVARGDAGALLIWDKYLDNLAVAVSNLRMAYDTDIILGGYVGGYLEPYMLQLGKKVVSYNIFESDMSYLRTCYYQGEASAVGAAVYFLEVYMHHL